MALLSILLGTICYVLAFPTYDLWPLAYLAMPFWIYGLLRTHSKKELWAAIALVNFGIGLGGFHWITFVMQEFGLMPFPMAFLMLILFCFIAAPQFTAFAILFSWRKNFIINLSPLKRILFLSAGYCALEFLARQVKIFPEQIGATQIPFSLLIQNASWGGVTCLSFFVIGWGLFILEAKKLRLKLVWPVFATTILLLFGYFEIQKVEKNPSQEIRVGILQGNIGNLEKIISESGDIGGIDKVLQRYFHLMHENKMVDLLIWPETAYPISYPTNQNTNVGPIGQSYANKLQSVVKEIQTPTLFGGYETDTIEKADFNSAIFLNKKAETIGVYRKKYLLILGEYMPLANFFPSLKSLNPQMGDFTSGNSLQPIQWAEKGISISANICYEALIPEYMRNLAIQGSNLFLNLTNDSWFGPGMEPHQHLQLSVLRTIENRIPLLRATNTGISAVISSTGKITSSTKIGEATALVETIKIPHKPSFSLYRLWGESFAWVLVIISLFIFFRGFPASRRLDS